MDGYDPRCVHVDNEPARAKIIAAWLTSQGIPAQIMNENTSDAFTGMAFAITRQRVFAIEVWVDNAADVERAQQMLAERQTELVAKHATLEKDNDWVETRCEECDGFTTFPFAERGTVQSCPKCGAFIDVPDGEVLDDRDYEAIDDEVEE